MINSPFVDGAGSPRCLVFANGEYLPGVYNVKVENTNNFQADTFNVELAISAIPQSAVFYNWDQLDIVQIEILFGFPADPNNFGRSDLTSFFLGNVDDFEYDPIADTLKMAGRDLTSKLIDYKRAITFSSGSLRSSDVVTQIAKEVGLTAQVTQTSIAVGAFNQIIHALVKSQSTYWDIVCKLAQMEGFQVYVTGNVLHFEPTTQAVITQTIPAPTQAQIDAQKAAYDTAHAAFVAATAPVLALQKQDQALLANGSADAMSPAQLNKIADDLAALTASTNAKAAPLAAQSDAAYSKWQAMLKQQTVTIVNSYQINYVPPTGAIGYAQSSAVKLMFNRNLSIAKDIKVTVYSTSPKTKKAVMETAVRTRSRNAVTRNIASQQGQPPLNYTYNIPNLTATQATKAAQEILIKLSLHEMNVHASLPGDLILTPRTPITIVGTTTAFDQTYYPTSVTRNFSTEGGFTMDVIAKNQTPNNPE